MTTEKKNRKWQILANKISIIAAVVATPIAIYTTFFVSKEGNSPDKSILSEDSSLTKKTELGSGNSIERTEIHQGQDNEARKSLNIGDSNNIKDFKIYQ